LNCKGAKKIKYEETIQKLSEEVKIATAKLQQITVVGESARKKLEKMGPTLANCNHTIAKLEIKLKLTEEGKKAFQKKFDKLRSDYKKLEKR
jgi:chromosome segregation ATPase